MKQISQIRPSSIAGQWYPGDARRLANSVDHYLEAARLPKLDGEVVAVMAPHAGHMYSGGVAGHAFAALRGLSPDVVAVVSPMHYPYPESLLTSAHQEYQTPLGEIAVDQQAIQLLQDDLLDSAGLRMSQISNDPEHALEIELPFLQRALQKPFRLIPVMVREQSSMVARSLGQALGRLFAGLGEQSGLLVASTDLSHFYTQTQAEQLDENFLQQVKAFDPQGVIEVEEKGLGFACGRGALAAVMWAAKELGANHAKVLHYATSGEVSGDYERVVGYAAAVFLRKKSE